MSKKPVNNSKKVIVALSGGVDSAVAAALLKKQGHDVIGVHFLFCGPAWKPNFQVRGIAKKLGIPLKIVDARKDFKKRVIDYFLKEYKAGRTPNPCVVCNKEMKFRMLFNLMKREKAEYAATGHYARIKREFPISPLHRSSSEASNFQFPNKFQKSKSKLQITDYGLLSAKDKSKDQSYFLYRLAQKDLAKIIFPLGDYKKTEVKRIAKKMNLPVQSGESQDVCFLARNDLNTYLSKYLKSSRGNIVDARGNIIGLHRGLPFYTIGQRKGIEIGPPASRQMREVLPARSCNIVAGGRASGTGPYFVVGKNSRKNELVVSDDPKKLLTKKFFVKRANWIYPETKFPLRADVQIRYHAEKVSAIIRKAGDGRWEVRSEKPLRAATPGQSAVFFRGGEVLGGGVISHANTREL